MLSALALAHDGTKLLVVTENGYGKRPTFRNIKFKTAADEAYIPIRLPKKTGLVGDSATVTDDEDVMMITSDGVLIRMHTDEISSFGRQTQGVRIMRLADDVKLVSMAKTEREDEDENTEDTAEEENNAETAEPAEKR